MNSFLSFLFRDPLRKLIALLLTIVLYAVLNEGKQQQKELFKVPVEIKCDDDVFVAKIHKEATVQLTVRGSESKIKKLDMQTIRGEVEISRTAQGFESGSAVLYLDPKIFDCPQGIEIVSIEPEMLEIPVQRRTSRDIPIEPIVSGRPRQGMAHDGGRCSPDMVTVSGPERGIRNLEKIRTEQVVIPDGESRSFSKSVDLISPGEEFVMNISKTDVTVNITTDMSRRLPRKVAVQWHIPLNRKLAVRAETDAVAVTVAGQQDEINSITGEDIMVYADLSDPKYDSVGEHTVALKSLLKNSGNMVRITAVEPSEIKIFCEEPTAKSDKK